MPPLKSPDLRSIVQRMIDAGEPEEAIASVIRKFNEPKIEGDVYTGPDTFWGGVRQSFGGDVQDAELRGLKGWVSGALNIPGSVGRGLSSIGNLITDPVGTISSIPEGIGNMYDTMMQSGSNPEAFGEMVGGFVPDIMTGRAMGRIGMGAAQGARAIPSYMNKASAGRGLQTIGGIMEQHQPLSGMIPRMVEPRVARTAERFAGRGLRNIGESMAAPPPPPNVQFIPPQRGGIPNVPPNTGGLPATQGPIIQPPVTPPGPQGLPTGGGFNLGQGNTNYQMPSQWPTPPIEQPPSSMGVPRQLPPASTGPQMPPSSIAVNNAPPPFTSRGQAPVRTMSEQPPAVAAPAQAPPAQAAPTQGAPPKLSTLPRKQLTQKMFETLQRDGYKIVGVDSKNDFILSKQ